MSNKVFRVGPLMWAVLVAVPPSACHDNIDKGARDTAADTITDTRVIDVRDTAVDTIDANDTTPPADTTPVDGGDTTPGQGELGAPCDDAAECNGSFCLEALEHTVCSQTCAEACPNGWGCRQNVALLPDVAFVCMPPWPRFCRPCRSNADCLVDYDTTPHACISRGDEGAFCGSLCESDSDCPADSFCNVVQDIGGNPTRQCVPDSGICPCFPGAVAAGADTVCHTQNVFGRCPGSRLCEDDGLNACDAPEPVVDVCNGVDDNCDGSTDEAFVVSGCEIRNVFGVCKGTSSCTAEGQECDAQTPAAEACMDGTDNDCDGATDEEDAEGCVPYYYDGDADGYGVGEPRCLCAPDGFHSATVDGDCDDTAKKVHPEAVEVCNTIDDDCDDETDEVGAIGCTEFFADADEDHFGDQNDSACLCAPDGVYTTRNHADCDDSTALVSPAVTETCDNGIDNDCDGHTDEENAAGCHLTFADVDGDGYGNPADFRCLCVPSEPYTASIGGDCHDGEGTINPGLPEACGDNVDNNCDSLTDEPGAIGCAPFLRDDDKDGFGLDGDSLCLCEPTEAYHATTGGDCDDDDNASHPYAEEVCDGADNDCNDFVDEAGATGCTLFNADRDLDGEGTADTACLCGAAIPFTADNDVDCDDTNPFINHDADEVCNGLDDDCDGSTDEGVLGQCSPFYRDEDGDGWGLESDSRCLCGPDGAYTSTKPGDCNDERIDVYPLAQELCNAVDDDCDDETDEENALGCGIFFLDGDEDGAGRSGDTRCLCAADAETRYTALSAGDCDDNASAVHPGAEEVCNLVDDDCDGGVDELGATECMDFLRDTDGDGYGVALDKQCLCSPTGFYTATVPGDCDDIAGDINPGVTEVCDGVDNDCNGVADDPGLPECVDFFRDVDGDTWGHSLDKQCLCGAIGTYTATRGEDCDDLLASVNKDAEERCNQIDDDCDDDIDEVGAAGCVDFLRDEDGDGFGVTGDTQCLCQSDDLYRAVVGGDCEDLKIGVNPGATEACNDGVDDDCDGSSDIDGSAGCVLRYRDFDRDTHGKTGDSRCLCKVEAPYDATNDGDCDDGDFDIKPGVAEVCNGVDDDCDGLEDEVGAEGCETYYLDADGDGWGVPTDSFCLCEPQGAYSAQSFPDCDDGTALRAPDNEEICDTIDNNCILGVDEIGATGCKEVWQDVDDDTYGVDGTEVCLCLPEGDFDAIRGGDCDDIAPTVNPERVEVCDSIDNDCDGAVDEGCGLPTAGWPTFMQNNRRTGQTIPIHGPRSGDLKWKVQLDAAFAMANSPIIDEAGDIIVLLGDTLYKRRASDGKAIWSYALPEAAFAHASPTVRVGGSIVAAAGNQVVMVSKGGAEIWTVDFGGAGNDRIVGTPMVDPVGNIYVVSNTHIRRLDVTGAVAWATPIVNTNDHRSDPGLSPDGRIYFGASGGVYALTDDGTVIWTYDDNGAAPAASVTLTEVARILVPIGNTLYLLADGVTQALVIDSEGFGGDDIFTNAALYSDGWKCCNPKEFPVISPEGNNGLRLLEADLDEDWSRGVRKSSAPSSTPVIDRDGDMFVGSNRQGSGGARFYAYKLNGNQHWSYEVDGKDIDGAAAIGDGYVIFGDSTGTLYRVGE